MERVVPSLLPLKSGENFSVTNSNPEPHRERKSCPVTVAQHKASIPPITQLSCARGCFSVEKLHQHVAYLGRDGEDLIYKF